MARSARRELVLALAALIVLAGPALPVAAVSPSPAPVAPLDGATVASDAVVLRWTEVPGARYEVLWSDDGTVDAGGVIEDGTAVTVEGTSLELSDAGPGSYVWQVRVLPEGSWSPFSTFSVETELETHALPVESDAPPVAPEGGTTDEGLAAIPAAVWIGGAVLFALLLLVVVFRHARRRPPEPEL